MGSLDSALGQVAKTLVKFGGRPATLVRPGPGGAYVPATGRVTGASPDTLSYPCEVVFAEYSASQIDGTLIRAGDRRAIVSRLRLGTEPVPNSDTLVEGGRTWQIVRLVGYSSGSQEAAFECQVRR